MVVEQCLYGSCLRLSALPTTHGMQVKVLQGWQKAGRCRHDKSVSAVVAVVQHNKSVSAVVAVSLYGHWRNGFQKNGCRI